MKIFNLRESFDPVARGPSAMILQNPIPRTRGGTRNGIHTAMTGIIPEKKMVCQRTG